MVTWGPFDLDGLPQTHLVILEEQQGYRARRNDDTIRSDVPS
jgi:hypothetical protein